MEKHTSALTTDGKQNDKEPIFFRKFFSKKEADDLFERCVKEIPWAKKKWMDTGYILPQLAVHYDQKMRKENPCSIVEELAERIGKTFGARSSDIWCNKFNDGKHHIEWHQDNYGEHCFIISFGSTRQLEIRPLSDKVSVISHDVQHGDVYYFSPSWDKNHEHRVPSNDLSKHCRVSFVIFTNKPTNLK
mmetsp:Transcript_7613/g.11529  ORF Transcript_7613/g.11529 Transcript_7613/m.11529 type:complete len:189 (-) Transcript_7613:39-605(-)